MDHPYQPHPFDTDLATAERAAWQRGDYRMAALLGAVLDQEGKPEPEELEQAKEEAAAAERRAEEAESRASVLETAGDAAYDMLHALAQRIEAYPRVPKAELLEALSTAMAALVVPE